MRSTFYYDPELLIEHFGITGKNGRRPRLDGEELQACCPFPHRKNGEVYYERNPSFAINVKTGYYNCYSCLRSGRGLDSLCWKLDKEIIHFTKIYGEIREKQDDKDEMFLHNTLIKALSRNPEIVEDYFVSRGWGSGKNVVRTHILGAKKDGTTIYCPVRNVKGDLAGWVTRRSDMEPRWVNQPKGFDRESILYGIYEARLSGKEVYVTESVSDALRLLVAGYSAVSTMGASISEEQIELLLSEFDVITTVNQEDEPGYAWASKILGDCCKRAVTYAVRFPGYKDPGEVVDVNIIHKRIGLRKLVKSVPNSKERKYVGRNSISSNRSR